MRFLRVAEVQAVGQPERLGADARQVGGALVHRLRGAPPRVARDAPAVSVDRDRDRGAVRQREHGGIGLVRPPEGTRLDDRVVLLEHRPARGEVGGAEEGEQDLAGRLVPVQHARAPWCGVNRWLIGGGRSRLEVVERAVVHQDMNREIGDDRAVIEDPQPILIGDGTDRGREHLPALAHVHQLAHVLGRDHAQHPLLGLGDHDLEGLHPRLAQRDAGDVDVEPHAALARHLRSR